MTMGNLAAFVHGAAVVYPGRVFNPRHALECVVAQRCTALYGVPTMFIAELSGTSASCGVLLARLAHDSIAAPTLHP